MKNYILLLLALSVISDCFSQNSECQEDFLYLKNFIIKNSISYDKTIKDKNGFEQKMDSIYHLMLTNKDEEFECRKYLSMILSEIRDGHLSIMVNGVNLKDSITKSQLLKSNRISKRKSTELDLDSLVRLNKYKVADYYRADVKVLNYEKNEHKKIGIVLSSSVGYWKKGDVFYTIDKKNGKYHSVFYNHLNEPSYSVNETLSEAYSKFYLCNYGKSNCFYPLKSTQPYILKIIDDETFYIAIKSFKNQTKEHQKAQDDFFLNEVLPVYAKKKNLIIDIRNNSGGAIGGFYKFFKKLKKDKLNNTIYIMQNRGTASAAEIFTLLLKDFKKNVIIIGEKSAGMVAFRFPKKQVLPSGRYSFYYTTEIYDKNYKNWLKYENRGIEPDFYLKENVDWVKQAIEIVNKR